MCIDEAIAIATFSGVAGGYRAYLGHGRGTDAIIGATGGPKSTLNPKPLNPQTLNPKPLNP